MTVSPRSYLYVPDGFDPADVLPPELARHGDEARFFLHKIITGMVARRADDRGFIPLKAAIISPFFSRYAVYVKVRDALIEAGVVVTDRRYIPGQKCKGFKLGPDWIGRRHRRVAVTCPTLLAKLLEARPAAPVGDVHAYLERCLRELEIDYPAALDALLAGGFEPSDETAIQLIRDRQWFFSVCEYGRVHTNLTNLKSSMRAFLSHRARPLVNLDISNSQPLFFGVLLREKYASGPMPDDVRHYLELVQEGRFYEVLMAAGGIPPENRGAFKRAFFGHVFYCENDPPTKKARLFGEVFPEVYAEIRRRKESYYADFSRAMQRAESALMIGQVAARVMKELRGAWIATIHDSIVTTQDRAEAVGAILREEFAGVGLVPTIKAEPLGPAHRRLADAA